MSACHMSLSRRLLLGGSVVLFASLGTLLNAQENPSAPGAPEICKFVGGPQFGGVEPPIVVNATCVDPDFNDKTLVIDSTQEQVLTLPGGATIPYTEVKGHFPPLRTAAELPAGVTGSPSTANHSVVWRFPEKKFWHNRFFQQTYPLPIESLNVVDSQFAFTSGAFTVGVISPLRRSLPRSMQINCMAIEAGSTAISGARAVDRCNPWVPTKAPPEFGMGSSQS